MPGGGLCRVGCGVPPQALCPRGGLALPLVVAEEVAKVRGRAGQPGVVAVLLRSHLGPAATPAPADPDGLVCSPSPPPAPARGEGAGRHDAGWGRGGALPHERNPMGQSRAARSSGSHSSQAGWRAVTTPLPLTPAPARGEGAGPASGVGAALCNCSRGGWTPRGLGAFVAIVAVPVSLSPPPAPASAEGAGLGSTLRPRADLRVGAWGLRKPRAGGWARAAQRARPGWGCGAGFGRTLVLRFPRMVRVGPAVRGRASGLPPHFVPFVTPADIYRSGLGSSVPGPG